MPNTMGKVTDSAEQMLKGHKEVLLFGGQKIENDRFAEVIISNATAGYETSLSIFYV